MKIAFLHQSSYFLDRLSLGLAKQLSAHAYHDWIADHEAPESDIDVLLVVGHLDRTQLRKLAKLFFVQTTSAGYDGIDVDAATELGIWVSSSPSGVTGNATSVAEWAVFLMLGASRNVNRSLASVRDHTIKATNLNSALSGKCVCVVGLGAIGRLLIERLRPFGMTFRGTDASPENAPHGVAAFAPEQLNEAVAQADYVVVCAPGGPDNEDLIGPHVFEAMKGGAILVNVSRGSLVDEVALARAITSGKVAAAGLDVLKTEPANPANPLLMLPQVLITPHMAGGTDVMLDGTIDYVASVIVDLEAGRYPASTLNAPKAPRRTLRPKAKAQR